MFLTYIHNLPVGFSVRHFFMGIEQRNDLNKSSEDIVTICFKND